MWSRSGSDEKWQTPRTYRVTNTLKPGLTGPLGNFSWPVSIACFCYRPSNVFIWTSWCWKNTFHIPAAISPGHMISICWVHEKPTTSNHIINKGEWSLDVWLHLCDYANMRLHFEPFYKTEWQAVQFCCNIETREMMIRLNTTVNTAGS